MYDRLIESCRLLGPMEEAPKKTCIHLNRRSAFAGVYARNGYLLVEIVFLPDGSGRWLVCGVLGLFHGLYYALLMREGGFSVGYVLAGVFLVEAGASTICYVVWSRIRNPIRRLSSASTETAPSR